MTVLAPLAHALRTLLPSIAQHRSRDAAIIRRVWDEAATLRSDADRGLARRVESLRELVRGGIELTSQEVSVPAFALVCEAARRTLGITYYDVQIQAGLVLARKSIAEMATGEGKTFVAAFPAFLHALARRGVHVMTVNSYLAERDCTLLTPLFKLLDTSVGLLRPRGSAAEKRAAYRCDVTYGPGYEFGFDYLRDQIAHLSVPRRRLGESLRSLLADAPVPQPENVQRGHAFAIVDEADSVVIDEATTPLVLAGSPATTAIDATVFHQAKQAAEQLAMEQDYVVDPSAKLVRLTDRGVERVAALVGPAAASGLQRPWHRYVEQALYAAIFLNRDVDYIVRDGRVWLVDEFTGRIFADRTLRDGLHQAVEAREGLAGTAETQPLGRISRQRFVRLYDGVCGMTGTAMGSEREFQEAYGLPVVPIPTRLPCRRESLPTRYFGTQESKWHAIVDDVQRRSRAGQPVLVGTRTIESSRILAELLRSQGTAFRLLNGTQDEEESQIVGRAGEAGAVTIATNMAGRGTDIKLAPGVAELGGLHVIGTERHESTRVDRQLAGRTARQGDPGSCQFFVSADDSLIRRHAPWLSDRMKQSSHPSPLRPSPLAARGEGLGVRGAVAGSATSVHSYFSRQVTNLQRLAERQSVERRRELFAQDRWLEQVLDRLASEGSS